MLQIGLLPDLETRLTSELNDLAAGKDLAAETLKEADEKHADAKDDMAGESDGDKAGDKDDKDDDTAKVGCSQRR